MQGSDVGLQLPNPLDGPNEFFQWVITFKSPVDVYNENILFLLMEITVFLTFIPICIVVAVDKGIKHFHFIVAEIVAGLTIETLGVVYPRFNSWWYFQGMVCFFGRTIPVSIILVYSLVGYTAWAPAKHMKMSIIAESATTSLASFLFLFGGELLCTKCLFWTWHTSDTYTTERMFGIPYGEFLILSSKFGLNAFMFRILWTIVKKQKRNRRRLLSWPCSIVTGFLSGFIAIFLYIAMLYIVKDRMGGSPQLVAFLYLSCYILPMWTENKAAPQRPKVGLKKMFQNIDFLLPVVLYLAIFVSMFVVRPENIRAVGHHERLGPCNETEIVTHGIEGETRRGFRCVADFLSNGSQMDMYDFDFHCLTEMEKMDILNSTAQWYPLCGTPYRNRAEFYCRVGLNVLVGLFFIFQVFRYGPQDGARTPLIAKVMNTALSTVCRGHSKKKQVTPTIL